MISRRVFLRGAATMACSAAAHPLLSSMTFASAPGENRLVVIILRGAMDGIDVVQPVGDRDLARHRRALPVGEAAGALPLDGFFMLNKGLAPLMPLWAAGELGFVHATSTPYRDKRSHFDGQDLLEAGTGGDVSAELIRQGWLNRLLQTMPGARAETAFSVGLDEMRILAGDAPALSWAPETRFKISPQAQLLLGHVYHDDPLFSDALARAQAIGDGRVSADLSGDAGGEGGHGPTLALARFAAERLNGETRIAAFSLTGWDTHRGQPAGLGTALSRLSDAVLELRRGLGANWGRTAVMAMTEFGRTVRENGTMGTDHGTGGAMLLAGGAIRGGKVYGRWPGLGEGDLYAERDLMPTSDVRAWAGWAMAGLFGASATDLTGTVFPGLDLGADPKFLA